LSLFITFEGGDGSGKTTQAKDLYKHLHDENHPIIYTREPGGTFLGQLLQRWIALPQGKLPMEPPENLQFPLIEPPIGDALLPDAVLHSTAPRAELLLFLISRAQLVDELILPSLRKGKIVICDRFSDSTVAYQGYGRGIDIDLIKIANKIATNGLKPDLTVLLDITPEKGLARKLGREFFETNHLAFHHKVRDGYLTLAAEEPERWLVIDATLAKTEIEKIIWDRVSRLLEIKTS
jgi:dTMP kinase